MENPFTLQTNPNEQAANSPAEDSQKNGVKKENAATKRAKRIEALKKKALALEQKKKQLEARMVQIANREKERGRAKDMKKLRSDFLISLGTFILQNRGLSVKDLSVPTLKEWDAAGRETTPQAIENVLSKLNALKK